MMDELEEKVNKALARCLDQVAAATQDTTKAMHYSQAAQNLSHVKINLESMKTLGKPTVKKSD